MAAEVTASDHPSARSLEIDMLLLSWLQRLPVILTSMPDFGSDPPPWPPK
jgi:hypothetical protein